MKVRKTNNDRSTADLRLQLRPLSLLGEWIGRDTFCLYLEKGMQVIGRFQASHDLSTKESLHRFHISTPATFRLYNVAQSTYSWSLYRIDSENRSQSLVDSTNSSLKEAVTAYENEFNEIEEKVRALSKNKNVGRREILEAWKCLKQEVRSAKTVLKSTFKKSKLLLESKLQIFNFYDQQVQNLKEEAQRKKILRRAKSEAKRLIQQSDSPSQVNDSNILEPLILIRHSSSHQRKSYGEDQMQLKVVVPAGQKFAHEKQSQGGQKHQDGQDWKKIILMAPDKKFSLLSDIVEQSYQESSSVGGLEREKAHISPFNDNVVQIQSDKNSENNQLNKNKTLQEEHHFVQNLRRAHTQETVKQTQKVVQQFMQESIEGLQPKEHYRQQLQLSHFPSDRTLKLYALVLLILVVIAIQSILYRSEENDKIPRRKRRRK